MLIFELLKAIFFGIVEGVTEWLPISSTGHLILVQEFLNFSNQDQNFTDMFNIVIQLGAILAVMVIYFERLNPFQPGKSTKEVRLTWQLWAKVVLACLPSAVIGLLFDSWFEARFNNMVSVAIMLLVYGFAFLWIENGRPQTAAKVADLDALPYQTALGIGFFQVLSIMPGTSRSGATILGGMLLGTSRSVATDFTFFLGIPTMFGYSGLKMVKFFLDGGSLGLSQILILLTAMITAFLVSLYAIRFLTGYVRKHDFTAFGFYRIGLGTLLLIYAAARFILG